MLQEMKDIVEKLKSRQIQRSEAVKDILKNSIESEQFLEGSFLRDVRPEELNFSVAGVDSSIIGQEFMTADLVMVRAIATIMRYEGNSKKSSSYSPSISPEPKFRISEGLDAHEVNWHKSLVRLQEEYGLAYSIAEGGLADFILMDGSIIPLALDRPSEDSQLYEDYLVLVKTVAGLFRLCMEKGILIAGMAKDSRGKRILELFRSLHPEKAGAFGNDVSLLYELMPACTRTSIVGYENPDSARQGKNLILRDIEKAGFSGTVNVYYQRVSMQDKPIRIEIINSDPDSVAGKIHSLCSISRRYTYPAVLIDADLRAKVEPRDLDRLIRVLTLELLQGMRRRNRPFR